MYVASFYCDCDKNIQNLGFPDYGKSHPVTKPAIV